MENEKLITTKQVPIFNKEAIKKGMFITIQHKGCGPINGIVSLVTEEKIYYYDRVGTDNYVLITNVVEGTTQVRVADSLPEESHQTTITLHNELNKIVNSAKLFMSPEEDFIYFTTGGKCRGRYFSHVRVDGLKYVPETKGEK